MGDRYQAYAEGLSGILSINDVRQMEGLPIQRPRWWEAWDVWLARHRNQLRYARTCCRVPSDPNPMPRLRLWLRSR